jgi:hypothetical protein
VTGLFCDKNSPLALLRLVQRFCPIILVWRGERFLTASLREPRPVSVAILCNQPAFLCLL